jgi:hypothetical protein
MAALRLRLLACVLLSVEVAKKKVMLVLKGTGGVEFLVVGGTSLSVGFKLFGVSQSDVFYEFPRSEL